MSEERVPYNYESDLGNVLRRYAEADDPVEQRALLRLFASYLETEFDRSAGRAQTAISSIELKVRDQVSETHDMVRSLGEFLQDARAQQRAEFEALQAGQQGIHVDLGNSTAALGGLQDALRDLQGMFSGLAETVSQLDADVAEIRDEQRAQRALSERKAAQIAALEEQMRVVTDELTRLRAHDPALSPADLGSLAELLTWWRAQQAERTHGA